MMGGTLGTINGGLLSGGCFESGRAGADIVLEEFCLIVCCILASSENRGLYSNNQQRLKSQRILTSYSAEIAFPVCSCLDLCLNPAALHVAAFRWLRAIDRDPLQAESGAGLSPE